MKIFYGHESIVFFPKPVLTIGTFDGVHQGHKSILKQVVNEAKIINGTSVLITFDPHPRKLISPNEPIKLISSLDERLAVVEESGIDVAVIIPFTLEFSKLSAQEYIELFLVKYFHPSIIVIGHDHHFGNDRKGDFLLLQAAGHKFDFEVKEISAKLLAEAAISSTQIRIALSKGQIQVANEMLGKPYQIKGKVIKGLQLGREMGFPTANIELIDQEKLVPGNGVYAVSILQNGDRLFGMLNIGFNPTVSIENKQKIEVHIFDFDRDIYYTEITIFFIAKIRNEEKFENLEALKSQLQKDKICVLNELKK